MDLVNLTVIQHNVLRWKTHKVNLMNIYNDIKPDIILLNSHGNKSNEKIKIYNYVTYQSNKLEDRNSRCAISIKLGIKHRIREQFYSDILSVEKDTDLGVIEIATSYVPPRIGFLHYPDFYRLFKQSHPVFLGTLFLRKLYLKNFNIKNKNNKISQRRGNSLRNEVRGWVELCSPDPLKPLPTG